MPTFKKPTMCQHCGKWRSGEKPKDYRVTGTHPSADQPLRFETRLHPSCKERLLNSPHIQRIEEVY